MELQKINLCWIEINTKNLDHNIAMYQKELPLHNQIIAMVKSNAYGHGSFEITKHLENNTLVYAFAVVNSQEASALRESGITKPIIVVGIINSQVNELVDLEIELTIYSKDIAEQLNQIAAKKNKILRVHVKVDTGLTRMGIFPEDLESFLTMLKKLQNLKVISIFTHLAKAYDLEASNQQEDKLYFFDHNLPTHIGSSKAHFAKFKHSHIYSRIGMGIFGYVLHQPDLQKKLKPVFALKSRIVLIKTVAAQTTIGYDHTFITTRVTTVAVLPIGYAEGINPALSNQGAVIICDKLAPIVGKISMNYTVVDITDIPECTLNDIAIFIGKSETKSLSLYDWTDQTGISPTHLTTNFKSTVTRICV
jgi:alanine racemase